MSFDIASIAVKETAKIELFGPSGDPLYDAEGRRLSVTVYGVGSKVFADAQNQAANRAMARAQKKIKLSAEDRARERAEFLADCTVSFNGFTYENGSDKQAFRACYEDSKMGWMTEQIDQKIGEWSNFTQDCLSS